MVRSRRFPLLALIGSAGFILLGNLVAQSVARHSAVPAVRAQTVTVTLPEQGSLTARVVEPTAIGTHPGLLLYALPVDPGVDAFARALAGRGWFVAVVDPRGTGANRAPVNAPGDLFNAEASLADTGPLLSWLSELSGVEAKRLAILGVRMAAPMVLAAKDTEPRLTSAVLLFPAIPEDGSALAAIAVRGKPSGVLVVSNVGFELPKEVTDLFTEPKATERTALRSLAMVAQDGQMLGTIDAWLRDPTNANG